MLRMIAALVAVACSGSVALALAAKLPVTPGAVYCGDSMDVSAEGIFAEEFSCEPLSFGDGGRATLLCKHGEPEWGPDWTMKVTLVEDVDKGTLTFIDDEGESPGVLTRCEPQ